MPETTTDVDEIDVKATVRLPKGYKAAIAKRDDVEGHEFEEEDPEERMFAINVFCCG